MNKIQLCVHTLYLQDGEKECLWLLDFAGAQDVCLLLVAGEYSLDGEELLPEWSSGLGERLCLWELSEGSLKIYTEKQQEHEIRKLAIKDQSQSKTTIKI